MRLTWSESFLSISAMIALIVPMTSSETTAVEQLVERVHLAGDGGRGEIVHALERDVDAQVALPGQCVRHAERDAGLHRLHAFVEVVDVDGEELALVHRRQRLLRIAGKIRHHAHDEWDLNLFLRPIELDVVLDLHARRTIAGDEFLTAWFGHREISFNCASLKLGSRCSH
jgi:hypothetical protein